MVLNEILTEAKNLLEVPAKYLLICLPQDVRNADGRHKFVTCNEINYILKVENLNEFMLIKNADLYLGVYSPQMQSGDTFRVMSNGNRFDSIISDTNYFSGMLCNKGFIVVPLLTFESFRISVPSTWKETYLLCSILSYDKRRALCSSPFDLPIDGGNALRYVDGGLGFRKCPRYKISHDIKQEENDYEGKRNFKRLKQ